MSDDFEARAERIFQQMKQPKPGAKKRSSLLHNLETLIDNPDSYGEAKKYVRSTIYDHPDDFLPDLTVDHFDMRAEIKPMAAGIARHAIKSLLRDQETSRTGKLPEKDIPRAAYEFALTVIGHEGPRRAQ